MSAIAGAAGSLPFRPAGRKIKQHRRKKESGATGSWDHVRELARTKEEEDTTVASLAIVAESQEGSVKIVIPPVLPGRFVARPPSRAAAGDSLTPTASVYGLSLMRVRYWRVHAADSSPRASSTSAMSPISPGSDRALLSVTTIAPAAKKQRSREVLSWLKDALTPSYYKLVKHGDAGSDTDSVEATPVIVGLDAEWRPQFRPGSPENPISLVQICIIRSEASGGAAGDSECGGPATSSSSSSSAASSAPVASSAAARMADARAIGSDRVLIVHVTREHGLPRPLQRLLGAPWAIKTGVGVAGDASKLASDHGVHVSPVFDPAAVWKKRLEAMGRGGGRLEGLRALSVRLLGVPQSESKQWKSKSTTLSNWAAVPLRPRQVRYAALDAWASASLAAVLGVHEGEAVARAWAGEWGKRTARAGGMLGAAASVGPGAGAGAGPGPDRRRGSGMGGGGRGRPGRGRSGSRSGGGASLGYKRKRGASGSRGGRRKEGGERGSNGHKAGDRKKRRAGGS